MEVDGVVVLFNAFILGISFLRERSDRQMFALRQQLKIQYRYVCCIVGDIIAEPL